MKWNKRVKKRSGKCPKQNTIKYTFAGRVNRRRKNIMTKLNELKEKIEKGQRISCTE